MARRGQAWHALHAFAWSLGKASLRAPEHLAGAFCFLQAHDGNCQGPGWGVCPLLRSEVGFRGANRKRFAHTEFFWVDPKRSYTCLGRTLESSIVRL